MNRVRKYFVSGTSMLVVGTLLWLFAGGIETPVFTLTKVGIVLMVIGGLEIAYALYLNVRGGETSAS